MHGISRISRKSTVLHGISKYLKGFQKTSKILRNFKIKIFQGNPWNVTGFKRISKIFLELQKNSNVLNFERYQRISIEMK